jgi:hypothetical protein
VGPRASLDDVEERKFLALSELSDPSVDQPVASRYTDWTDKILNYRNYWIVVHTVSMTILDCTFP